MLMFIFSILFFASVFISVGVEVEGNDSDESSLDFTHFTIMILGLFKGAVAGPDTPKYGNLQKYRSNVDRSDVTEDLKNFNWFITESV